MWQHAVNIFFGLGILLVVFLFRYSFNPLLGWVLIVSGGIITVAAVWGWFDDMSGYNMPLNTELQADSTSYE